MSNKVEKSLAGVDAESPRPVPGIGFLPCPFCGAKAKAYGNKGWMKIKHNSDCFICDFDNYLSVYSAESWNTRTSARSGDSDDE